MAWTDITRRWDLPAFACDIVEQVVRVYWIGG